MDHCFTKGQVVKNPSMGLRRGPWKDSTSMVQNECFFGKPGAAIHYHFETRQIANVDVSNPTRLVAMASQKWGVGSNN